MLLERLIVEIGADTRGLRQGVQQANTQLGGLAKGAKFAGAAVAGIVAGKALRELNQLIKVGGEATNLMAAFERRTGAGAAGLRTLQEATRGLIPTTQLLAQANTALALGSAKSVDQVAELAAVSLDLSKALGIDAAFALNSLNTGIARQSRLYLDNLGIIISVEEANEKYARSLGKASSELTDLEKREAFRAEALRKARRLVDDFGGSADNNADKVQRLATSIENLSTATGRFLAQDGTIGFWLDFAAKFLNNVSGSEIGEGARDALGLASGVGGRSNILTLQQDLRRLTDLQETLRQAQRAGTVVRGITDLPGAIGAYQSAIVAIQQRLTALSGSSSPGGEGAIAIALGFTNENAAKLKAAISDTEQALADARFEQAFAADTEAAKDLQDEIAELEARLVALKRARDRTFGGPAGLDLLTDTPTAPTRARASGRGFSIPDIYPSTPPPRPGFETEGTERFIDRLMGGLGSAFDRLFDPQLIGSQLAGGALSAGIGLAMESLGSFFGPSEAEVQARQLAAEVTQANTRAIENLTANIGNLIGSQTGGAFEEQRRLVPLIESLLSGGAPFDLSALSEAGFGLEKLQEIATRFGVTLSLVDEKSFKSSFEAFLRALEESTAGLQELLGSFDTGFSMLQRRFGLLDIDDPLQQFEEVIDFIAGFVTPEFAAQLKALTPDTFDDFLKGVFEGIKTGGFDPSILGELGFFEFLDALGLAEGALDGVADAANAVTGALYNVPQGFKYARAVFQASDPEMRSPGSRTGGEGGIPDVGGVLTVSFGDINIRSSNVNDAPRLAHQVIREVGREIARGGGEDFRRLAARSTNSRSGVLGA